MQTPVLFFVLLLTIIVMTGLEETCAKTVLPLECQILYAQKKAQVNDASIFQRSNLRCLAMAAAINCTRSSQDKDMAAGMQQDVQDRIRQMTNDMQDLCGGCPGPRGFSWVLLLLTTMAAHLWGNAIVSSS